MAKQKKNPGGSADVKRRGAKAIVVPLTPRQHALAQRAAGTYTGKERAVSRFAAAVLEAASIARLEEMGIDSSEIESEKT